MTDNPFAPISRLKPEDIRWIEQRTPAQEAGYFDLGDSQGYREATPEKVERVPSTAHWRDDPAKAPFASKYEHVKSIKDGKLVLGGAQQPGRHKSDTADLTYQWDPRSREFVLQDAQATKSVSAKQRGAAGFGQALSLLSMAVPGIGTALGSALGLTGAAAGIAGNAALSTGLAALGGARGSNLLRTGLAAGVTGGINAAGKAFGLNPLLTRAGSSLASTAIRGGDPRNALIGAITGSINTGNPVANMLMKTIISQAAQQGIRP